MKVVFLFLFFTFTSLFASQIEAKNDVKDEFSKGIVYYKSKDFKKSYDIFSKIYLQKLSDIKFNFYYGRSAYETGHYEVALAAFERVEMQDGSNLRNRLEMARTYFMLKMYEDSEVAYRDVLANPNIPDKIRQNIELSLSRVTKVQKKSFTHTLAMLDFVYDSNVNYGSIDDYEYAGLTLPRIDEVSDTAIQFYGNVTNIYDIGDKNGFALKNSISLYLKEYSTLDNYSVQYLSYAPSLIYKETSYNVELIVGLDILKLGDHKYLTSTSFIPKFEYNHSPILKSVAYLKYQVKDYARDEEHDLDAKRYELAYALQKILTPRSLIKGSMFAIKEKKIRGQNIYVDFNEYKINATYVNQLTSDYGIELYAQAKQRKYKDYSHGFDSKRKDIGGLGSLAFTIKLLPTLRVKLKTSYEYVNSNQDRFSYKKQTASVGLVKTF